MGRKERKTESQGRGKYICIRGIFIVPLQGNVQGRAGGGGGPDSPEFPDTPGILRRRKEKRKEREKAERAATASLQSGPEDGMEAATVLLHGEPVGEEGEKPVMALWKALLLVVVSIGARVWGSNLLVKGASGIAMELGEVLGVSAQEMERIIGLTVVAVGTSLPELFASVIAARKGETDMAVGNIIGSVTFNILCVIGVSSAITPIRDAWSGWAMDYGLMVLLGALLWFFLWTKHRLERWEGAVLLAMYVAFLGKTLMI